MLAITSESAKPIRIRKNYNIKLPKTFRKRFTRPYDKFLSILLRNLTLLTSDQIKESLVQEIASPMDWLVWLNDEDRVLFQSLKNETMPHVTNARFVLALLLVQDQLESNRKLKLQSYLDAKTVDPIATVDHIATGRQASYKINDIELLN
jgi:hypothetical protein